MKKKILYLALFAALCTAPFSSCKKYDDGPAFSLLSKKTRLQGAWKIELVTINDNDQTDFFKTILGENFVWEIEKDETWKQVGNFPDNGTWALDDAKEDITFKSATTGVDDEKYSIQRLKSKELWLKQTDSSGNVTFIKLMQ